MLAEQVRALCRAHLLAWCRRAAACATFDDVLALARVPAFHETLACWLTELPELHVNEDDAATLDTLWREFTDVFPFVHPDLGGTLSRRMLAAAAFLPAADRATLLQETAGYDGLRGRPFGPILAEAAHLAATAGNPWVCWSVPYTGAMAAVGQDCYLTARRYLERATRLLPGVPDAPLSYPSRFRRSNPAAGTARLDGDIAAGLGFPGRALAPYRRALAALRRHPQPRRDGYLWFAVADLWWRLGRPRSARRWYLRVLARSRATATCDTDLEVNALARLAVLHWEDRPQREAYLAAMLEAAATSGSGPLQALAGSTAALTATGAFRQRLQRRMGPPGVRWPPSRSLSELR